MKIILSLILTAISCSQPEIKNTSSTTRIEHIYDESFSREELIVKYPILYQEENNLIKIKLSLLKEIVKQGPTSLTREEFQERLFSKNISIDFIVEEQFAYFVVKFPKENFDFSLNLFNNLIQNLKMREGTYLEAQNNVLRMLKNQIKYQPSLYFLNKAEHLISSKGLLEYVQNLKLENFKSEILNFINFENSHITIVGPIKENKIVKQTLDILQINNEFKYSKQHHFLNKDLKGSINHYLITNESLDDIHIMYLFELSQNTPENYVYLNLLFNILTEDDSSVLQDSFKNKSLFNNKSKIEFYYPMWAINTYTVTKNAMIARKLIFKALMKLSTEGVGSEKFKNAKNKLTIEFKKRNETRFEKLIESFNTRILLSSPEVYTQYVPILNKITLEEFNAFLKNEIKVESAKIFYQSKNENMKKLSRSLEIEKSEIKIIE